MDKQTYERHEGTVLIGAATPVGDTAKYVQNLLKKGVSPIDLCFLGGNAGQQAFKICERITLDLAKSGKEAAFIPERVLTSTVKRDITKQPVLVNNEQVYEIKDMFLWKLKD